MSSATSVPPTWWVTGGAGYLGSAIVRALAARKTKTVCFDLPGKAEAFVREHGLEGTVIPVSVDLTDLAAQARVIDETVRAHGAPSAVAHLTFASSSGKTLEQLTAEDFTRTVTLALTPTFEFAKNVIARMAANGGGSLVLFSSMYGVVAPDPRIYRAPMAPNPIDYGSSKAALIQMMRYLAVHGGPKQVRVNAIAPGPFPNPRIQREMPDFIEKLNAKTALGRVGQNPEIVGPTLFLMGPESSYVTGHCLMVDGGWTTW